MMVFRFVHFINRNENDNGSNVYLHILPLAELSEYVARIGYVANQRSDFRETNV